MTINSIQYIRSHNTQLENKSSYKDNALKIGITATALGITTLALTKGRTKSFEKALEKQGVTIKDGLAVVKDSGEKFSGAIKRNIKPFGLKKETVQFDKGIMTEKVYHDVFGREVAGEFYKDGILRVRIPGIHHTKNDVIYPFYVYDKNNKITITADNFGSKKGSVFEAMREKIKELD